MDLVLIFTIASLLWFWWDSSAAKEIATASAKRECQLSAVFFLDDTVAMSKLRVRRLRSGSLAFARRFIFEFCTDGEQRYTGYVDLLGKKVLQTHMDAYRLADDN